MSLTEASPGTLWDLALRTRDQAEGLAVEVTFMCITWFKTHIFVAIFKPYNYGYIYIYKNVYIYIYIHLARAALPR